MIRPALIRDRLLPLVARLPAPHFHETTQTLLVLQPDHLGDILLAQPAVRLLRDALPAWRLVAVVGPWSAEIARIAWPVDEVTELPFPGFDRRKIRSRFHPYRLLLTASAELRQRRPGAAVVMRRDAWWAAWLSSRSAPIVITSDDPRCVAFASQSVHTTTAHVSQVAVDIARQTIATLGGVIDTSVDLSLWLNRNDAASAESAELLEEADVGWPYAVIHPGTGAPVKEWPAHRWNQVAQHLQQQGFSIVVTGTASECELAEGVVEDVPDGRSLAGRTPLPVLIELLRGAALVLGPDNGPLHLAVAAGAPTLHLFGPSDSRRYGPLGDPRRQRVLSAGWRCPRCGDLSLSRPPGCGCMLAIGTDEVVRTAREMLSQHAPL